MSLRKPSSQVWRKLLPALAGIAVFALYLKQAPPGIAVFMALLGGFIVALSAMSKSARIKRFIVSSTILCRWLGIAIACAAAALPFAIIFLVPGWATPHTEDGPPTFLVVSIGLMFIGFLVILLPRIFASGDRSERLQREIEGTPSAPNFVGVRGCIAALRFVAAESRALLVTIAPYLVVCTVLPWGVFEWAAPDWVFHGQTLGSDGATPASGAPADLSIIFLLLSFVICFTIALPTFAVVWHRYIAYRRTPALGALLPGRRTFQYLWRLWMTNFACGVVIGIVSDNTPDLSSLLGVPAAWLVALICYFAAIGMAVWLSSKQLLTFPAIALDDTLLKSSDTASVSKLLGGGFPFGFFLLIVPCHFVYLATVLGVGWLFAVHGSLYAELATPFGLLLLFLMTAVAVTYLSQAYEAAMRSETGQRIRAFAFHNPDPAEI